MNMTNETIETEHYILAKGVDGEWYSKRKPKQTVSAWPLWIMFLIAVKAVAYILANS